MSNLTSRVAYFKGYTDKLAAEKQTGLEPYQKDLLIGGAGLTGSIAAAKAIPAIQEEFLRATDQDFADKLKEVSKQHPSVQPFDVTKRKITYKVPSGMTTPADALRAMDDFNKASWIKKLYKIFTGQRPSLPNNVMEETVSKGSSIQKHEQALERLIERMGNQTLLRRGVLPIELAAVKGGAKMLPLALAGALIAKRNLSNEQK